MEVRFLAKHGQPDAFAAVRFEPSRDGDYRAEAIVQSGGFRGQAEIYFRQQDVERFAAGLRAALAGFGKEEVKLESMSPGECVLHIRSLRPDGHGYLEASVGHLHLVTSEWSWDRTTVAFPLTTVGWDQVLEDLDAVLGVTFPGHPSV